MKWLKFIIRKANTLFRHPNVIFIKILQRYSLRINDRVYLKLMYFFHVGKFLDIDNPKTFNEKLQWLKLNYIKPEFTTMVDKLAVKDYVENKIGKEYVINTIAIWNDINSIDFNILPDSFVLKNTFGGGGNGIVVCHDKSKLNIKDTLKNLQKNFSLDLYKYGREWPYHNVPAKIFAEECLIDLEIGDLRDYKFFCFNGKAKFCKVDFGRFSKHRANYYNLNWEIQEYGEKVCPPDFDMKIEKPHNFYKMIELANNLAEGLPFVRIDLYNVSGRIYFGEITFYPASGFGPFTKKGIDEQWGNLINLPEKYINKGVI